MGDTPRITLQTIKVLQAFLRQPDSDHYGLEICDQTKLKYGTVQPILRRLEKAGWLESSWEDIDPRQAGRRARRYYRLTGLGSRKARSIISELQTPNSLATQPCGAS